LSRGNSTGRSFVIADLAAKKTKSQRRKFAIRELDARQLVAAKTKGRQIGGLKFVVGSSFRRVIQ
jgi:hypothetical protein